MCKLTHYSPFMLAAVVVVLSMGCDAPGSGVVVESTPQTSSATAPPPPPGGANDSPPAGGPSTADPNSGLAGDAALAAMPPDARAFLAVSEDLYKTLGTISDGPSANAVAPRIASLAAQLKRLFPAFKRFMATASEKQLELVFQEQADQLAQFGSNRSDLAELVKAPANEAFREAYITYLHVLRDDGTIGTRRQAERELAEIQN